MAVLEVDASAAESRPPISSLSAAKTLPPVDAKRHTEAGNHVNLWEAYEIWKADPDRVKILDCRTREEYAFVGHSAMAYNIPSRLWTGKWNEEDKGS